LPACRRFTDESSGAQHCYIVTKDRDGKTVTTTAGEVNSRPEGWLTTWNVGGHPIKGTNAADPSFFDQTGDGLCGNVDCIRQTGELIGTWHLPYNLRGPNSNTFVAEVMRICNLAVQLPPQAFGADAMLGPWKRLVR
jgi:hypothetical protein